MNNKAVSGKGNAIQFNPMISADSKIFMLSMHCKNLMGAAAPTRLFRHLPSYAAPLASLFFATLEYAPLMRPAIIAIALALITKQVYLSLFAGIFAGAMFLAGGNPIEAISNLFITNFKGEIL